jgi:hypothetical protein
MRRSDGFALTAGDRSTSAPDENRLLGWQVKGLFQIGAQLGNDRHPAHPARFEMLGFATGDPKALPLLIHIDLHACRRLMKKRRGVEILLDKGR